MPAGFERDVERGSFRALAGLIEREDLRVGPAEAAMVPPADDVAISDDDGADEGIRRGVALRDLREIERQVQELLVVQRAAS